MSNYFFLRSCCAVRCNILLETRIWPTKTPLALSLRVMHLILALVKSPSTRIIHDWRGRYGEKGWGGNELGAERGEEWPWIKLWCRDVAQWAAVAVRYKAYDRCLSWKCITALGLRLSKFSWVLKGIRNQNTQSFHNCQHAFFPAASTQMFTPSLHLPVIFRDRHAHTYPRCHASTCTCTYNKTKKEIFPPLSIHILIKPPQL